MVRIRKVSGGRTTFRSREEPVVVGDEITVTEGKATYLCDTRKTFVRVVDADTDATVTDELNTGDAADAGVTSESLPVTPSEVNVDTLADELQAVDDPAVLEDILAAERANENRTTAIDEIESRRAELTGG